MALDTCKLEYTCTLSEETLNIAVKELNEDPATRMIEMKTFAERLLRYPGLRPCTDPAFLLQFLRVCKFDQERAFKKILGYYQMRKENPSIFDGLKPSAILHVYRSCILQVHYPYRDRLGRKICFLYPANTDFHRFSMEDAMKSYYIDNWKTLQEEETQVRGMTVVMDLKDYTLSKFLSDSSFRFKVSRLWQDSIPNRTKAILLVNEIGVIDLVMSFLKQTLKLKLAKRVYNIGTDWQKLHEVIDPAYLPPQYGGTLLSDSMESIHQKRTAELLQCDKSMEEYGKYGFVDFTVGADTQKHQMDAISRMPGTFRKLDPQ